MRKALFFSICRIGDCDALHRSFIGAHRTHCMMLKNQRIERKRSACRFPAALFFGRYPSVWPRAYRVRP